MLFPLSTHFGSGEPRRLWEWLKLFGSLFNALEVPASQVVAEVFNAVARFDCDLDAFPLGVGVRRRGDHLVVRDFLVKGYPEQAFFAGNAPRRPKARQ